MQVNDRIVKTNSEIINLIREGINPLDYIKDDVDMDLVCNAIAHVKESEDPYWDDSAETLLKSIVFYLLFKGGETKTLSRCLEIVELGLNDANSRETIGKMLECDERSNVLFKAIETASDKTYTSIFETLKDKLNEIL